jgi:hypothetical protein
MGKKNSQIHFFIETERLDQIKKEAKDKGITFSELLRLKLLGPPLPKEISLLRKLKEELVK